MKKILITGKNSYIGNSLETHLNESKDNYDITKISMRDDSWKELDLSVYDCIVHVAGIAHTSKDKSQEQLYYDVNTKLTIELATKAKQDGAKQFIFMSSIIVYGDSKLEDNVITKDTIPNPSDFYGMSKLRAEEGIKELQDDNFNIVIVRPPMIYGKGSKGNYPRLAKLAVKTPIFPDYPNQRSMLYIENLTEFLKIIIDNSKAGLFFPQNKEYVCTSDMVKMIAEVHNHKLITTKVFNPNIRLLMFNDTIKKVFGNLVYELDNDDNKIEYSLYSINQSIIKTEDNDER